MRRLLRHPPKRRIAFPPPPPEFMEVDEVLEELKLTHEELLILMQNNRAPSPERRFEKINGRWMPRPLWRRASVYQTALTRVLIAAYLPPPTTAPTPPAATDGPTPTQTD